MTKIPNSKIFRGLIIIKYNNTKIEGKNALQVELKNEQKRRNVILNTTTYITSVHQNLQHLTW